MTKVQKTDKKGRNTKNITKAQTQNRRQRKTQTLNRWLLKSKRKIDDDEGPKNR